MIKCKIDVEENSKCTQCCKTCEDTCNKKCVFAKFNRECDNQIDEEEPGITLVGITCPECKKYQYVIMKDQRFKCECGFEDDLVIREVEEDEGN